MWTVKGIAVNARRAAVHSGDSELRNRTRQPPSDPEGSACCCSHTGRTSAGASKDTSTAYVSPPRIPRRTNSAASIGSSRGVNRAPVAKGSATRSTRKVRQSPRSRSYAIRYHRLPVLTSR